MSGRAQNLPYKKIIECIQNYYDVRYSTAKYLYFRGLRAKRQDEHRLPLDRDTQDMIIFADSTVNWALVNVGEEKEALQKNGIYLERANSLQTADLDSEESWEVFRSKKNKREHNKIQNVLKNAGLHV